MSRVSAAREANVREALPHYHPTRRFQVTRKLSQSMLQANLCFCPDCLKQRPERAALKAIRDRGMRARLSLAGVPE